MMRAPSDAVKGRIIRLMQWDNRRIPRTGYEDVGEEPDSHKGLSVFWFQRKWVLAGSSIDQLPDIIAKGGPLAEGEQFSRRVPPGGKTPSEKNAIDELKRKQRLDRKTIADQQQLLEQQQQALAEMSARLERLEGTKSGKVVQMRGSKRAKAQSK